MPSIIIREINNTTGGDSTQLTDVVYVPGFVSIDVGSKPSAETAVAPRVPTIVYNVSDFEAYFGKKPAVFKSEQSFPAISRGGTLYTFDSNALPPDASGMFVAGDVDPGYVYAKELLNLGIPVIYERINGENEEPNVSAMYEAMLGTDDVVEITYIKNADGGHIITVNEVAPIVQEGEQTPDSVFQVYHPDMQYYKPDDSGDYIFPDNIKVLDSMRNDEYASYFVQDANGDYSLVGSHFTKNASFEFPYRKLSARINTNAVDGVRDLANWYVENSEGTYVKTLNTYVLATTVSGSNRYIISPVEQGETGTLEAVQEGEGLYFVPMENGSYTSTQDAEGTYFTFVRGGESVYYPVPTVAQNYAVITLEDDEDIYFDNAVNLEDVTDAFLYKQKSQSSFVEYPYQKYGVVPTAEVNDYRYYQNVVVIEDGKAGIYENLKDKGEYTVKYLTSGGYPTYEFGENVVVAGMIDTAANRGDCIALIDHTDNTDRSLNDKNPTSVYYSVYQNSMNGGLFAQGTYASMFTPWAKYSVPRSAISLDMPGSFAYLSALGIALQTNDRWLAIAGATRGVVPNFISACTKERLTNALADAYTQRDRIAINPITVIKPYGNLIWGNRTLYTATGTAGNNLNAWSFLNYRNMASDIKKLVYETAKRYTFEQNSDILWINFKSGITPLLDKMKSGYGIVDYKITKGETKEKAKLVAVITIIPIYPVEDFDITLVVEDEEVSVS